MRLDVSSVIYTPGAVLPFSMDLDLSDYDLYGSQVLPDPVHVEGRVINRAGMLVFQADVSMELHLHCDSCGKPFLRRKTVPLENMIVTELANEGDDDALELLVLDGSWLDPDELIHDTVVFAIDTKNLCREDCKGRCGRCGKDLNEGPCDCRPEPDPRFAVLKQLLPQDD